MTVGVEDERVVSSVADHGVGIPAAAQARIFERFYKVDRARVRGEAGGTGLGLAIARHIIERHGGTIWVEFGRRGRLDLQFALPLARTPDEAEHEAEQPMDDLHVATLNIRNLADRWQERLPLLLADMAALQPDILALQEVDLPDAAGPADRGGRGGPLRGLSGPGPAGPSTATACWSASRWSPTDVDRLDLGLHRSALRVSVSFPEARRCWWW